MTKYGMLALKIGGDKLPIQVCSSYAGYYIGTMDPDGYPCSRESYDYFKTRQAAEVAIQEGSWQQREHP